MLVVSRITFPIYWTHTNGQVLCTKPYLLPGRCYLHDRFTDEEAAIQLRWFAQGYRAGKWWLGSRSWLVWTRGPSIFALYHIFIFIKIQIETQCQLTPVTCYVTNDARRHWQCSIGCLSSWLWHVTQVEVGRGRSRFVCLLSQCYPL